ncbi:MAG: hypothetical protein JWR11_601 [Mycobacterium sp.]|jgi:hypothetical protein|nr:hypothetical protein [Mycobacterium sp.]
MNRLIGAALVIVGLALGCTPVVSADPGQDGYDDVYGLITADEEQEIWANGHRNCVTLDRAMEASPPLTSKNIISVIESYRAQGWDVESASDIVWESVKGRCPEYLDAVKRAVRTYGDPS